VPSAEDLDFWLGTRTVRWGETDGEAGHNAITRTLRDHVVEEQFEGVPGRPRRYELFVFDPYREPWRQTWIDKAGNYFALEGNLVDGEVVLLCEHHNPPEQVYRMRFFDIASDRLTWTWERSIDAGVTFEELWRLAYERS
jgi:hypothetical protein